MNTYPFNQLRSLFLFLVASAICLSCAGATIRTVTSLSDSGAGTLRSTIAASASGDIINFSVSGTISLTTTELVIANNLTITGPGAGVLKVSGNNSHRVFNITSGTVSISDLTISDGRVLGTNGLSASKGENVVGGGIQNGAAASLTLTGCIISNNAAIGGQGGASNGGGGNGFGGGIYSEAPLILIQCALDGNTAQGGAGGGASGMGGEGWGGGFYGGSTISMIRCSISENNAIAGNGLNPGNGIGGGIYSYGTLNLTNCTVANNISSGGFNDSGGGIDNNGTLTIRSCTIAGNQSDRGGGVRGGGDIGNTILAGNLVNISGTNGSGTFVSSDYNFIQSTNGMTFSGATTHNILNVNPLLGPLQNNGGLTRTMALSPGSAAIDKGIRFGATNDQRGLLRPYDTELGNAAGGDASDIGAFEVNPGTFVVLNNNDTGAGSLRQAILDNNGLGGGNTITFSNTVTGIIPVIAGDLAVNDSVNIVGPGATVLKLSGNNNQRIFTLFAGNISISGLTISDGRVVGTAGTSGLNGQNTGGAGVLNIGTAVTTLTSCIITNHTSIGGQGGPSDGTGGNGFGGAIANYATIILNQCALDANTALGGAGGGAGGMGGQGWGGGLYNEGTARFSRCSISQNNATAGSGGGGPGGGLGGGMYNVGIVGLTNSTIANNIASGSSFDSGGGIANNGSVSLRNCTISGNQADFGGGLDGSADAGNTILAGNTAGSGPDGGTINSFDYNLIGNFAGVNISGTTTHVIIGQDPLLGPLADNGGLARSMALRFNSPAIDKGSSFGFTTDQRGAPRPFDFATVGNVGGGDGSDIGAFELGTPLLNISGNAPNVVLSWPAYYGDFTLQAVTALEVVNNWTSVPGTPVVVGGQFNVTDSAASGNKFYRLKSR